MGGYSVKQSKSGKRKADAILKILRTSVLIFVLNDCRFLPAGQSRSVLRTRNR